MRGMADSVLAFLFPLKEKNVAEEANLASANLLLHWRL